MERRLWEVNLSVLKEWKRRMLPSDSLLECVQITVIRDIRLLCLGLIFGFNCFQSYEPKGLLVKNELF